MKKFDHRKARREHIDKLRGRNFKYIKISSCQPLVKIRTGAGVVFRSLGTSEEDGA